MLTLAPNSCGCMRIVPGFRMKARAGSRSVSRQYFAVSPALTRFAQKALPCNDETREAFDSNTVP